VGVTVETEAVSLRRARKASYSMARASLRMARSEKSPAVKAALVRMALAVRGNCAKYLAALEALEGAV
jgi:hypothetical protein